MQRHEFEDADSGDELQLEAGITYTVVSTFVELDASEGAVEMNGQVDMDVVFTHRVRPHVMG